jgi:hypothetical protein
MMEVVVLLEAFWNTGRCATRIHTKEYVEF